MATTNRYATRVFAEHPLALWSLDEQADYINLLDPSALDSWTIENGYTSNAEDLPDRPTEHPFPLFPMTAIHEDDLESGAAIPEVYTIRLTSSESFSSSDLSYDLGSVAFGFYVYPYPSPNLAASTLYEESVQPLIDIYELLSNKISKPFSISDDKRKVEIRLGYETESSEKILGTTLTLFEDKDAGVINFENKWTFVSKTFQLPAEFETLRFVIEISYPYNVDNQYKVAINGISAGQWSEEFQAVSLGATASPVIGTPLGAVNGIETLAYGLQDASAYYLLSDDNVICAKNTGMPMVFGTSNSTVITENPGLPSIIFPGFGFLNEAGQYKTLTTEFWMQVQSKAVLPRKIFGPLDSSDGLYVDGAFLKLKINDYIGSHYVGEWDRPMLVNIRYSPSSASININGEQVLSFDINADNLTFPPKTLDDIDYDWLGFYAYEDVPQIKLESFAIYPYDVPAIVNKKRMVYGQGITFPQNVKGVSSTNTAFVDYQFSNYTKNYNYPVIGKWKNGASNNIAIESQYIGPANYSLPEIYFNNKTQDAWITDLGSVQDVVPFISLKPTSSWDLTEGHIYFKNINFLNEETRAVYASFTSSTDDSKQVLLQFVNEIKGSSLTAYLEDDTISYVLEYKNSAGQIQTKTLYSVTGHVAEDSFVAGININNFVKSFGNDAIYVFNRKHQIKLYVGGNKNLSETFSGKIYNVQFLNSNNLVDVESIFLSNGIPADYGDDFVSHDIDYVSYVSSYSLIPKNNIDVFGLDIASSFYWEDYVPLSYFGSYVKDKENQSLFSVDTIQFNVDYPRNNNLNYVYVNAGEPGIINKYRHGFSEGDRIFFETYGVLPTELLPQTQYFVNTVIDENSFTVSTTTTGDPIAISADGVGLHDALFAGTRIIIDQQATTNYAVITKESHGLSANSKISISTTGSLPSGITTDQDYYVYSVIDSDSFILGKLAFDQDPDGRTIQRFIQVVIGSEQSGTHFMLDSQHQNFLSFDTRGSLVKTYISFQYLKTGANASRTSFLKTYLLPETNIVQPGDDWFTSKYEIMDDTIIYPPVGVNPETVAIVVHIDGAVDGLTSNPVKIRSLQLASRALGESPNIIQTRFGYPIIPYRKADIYFDYKAQSPAVIYKGSTPYLYNTSTSGVRLRGDYFGSANYGLSFPINRNLDSYYKVGSIQMALRYDADFFPESPVQIFEIQSKDKYIKFYIVADSENRKRAQIYAVDANSGLLYSNLTFFIDGNPVARPVATIKSWFMLGLSFGSLLNFGSSLGALRVTSPIHINNLSFYQISQLDEAKVIALRKWTAVANPTLDWAYWQSGTELAGDFSWQNLLVLGEVDPVFIDGSDIYKEFVGTNQIVVRSERTLTFNNYRYRTYKDVRWLSQTIEAL